MADISPHYLIRYNHRPQLPEYTFYPGSELRGVAVAYWYNELLGEISPTILPVYKRQSRAWIDRWY